MIDWMYTKDYQGPHPTAVTDQAGPCDCLESTYDPWGNSVRTKSKQNYVGFGTAAVGSTSSVNGAQLLHHARVYVLGDFYGLKHIRELAMTKFRDGCTQGCSASKFPEVAHEVYSTTSEEDRGLRDIVVDTILKHRKMIDRPEMQSVIQQTALAFDLVMEAHKTGSHL